MLKKRILVIDGDYFANRTLGTVNMKDRVNNVETPLEQKNFRIALNSGLINLIEMFRPHIDNIVFCADNNSWRKSIVPVRPYYLDKNDNTPLGYKENRKSKKDESSINYENFYQIYSEFVDDVKTILNTAKINGLEGDDLFLLLSQKAKQLNFELLLFANDGDLVQTVNNNVVYLRNIKSKDAPEGEFVITKKMYDSIFDADVETKMLNSGYYQQYTNLFSMSIYSKQPVVRKINNGITTAKPFRTLLIKTICGDKKDNLFPVISWKAKTGTKWFKPTEKIIEASLKKLGKFMLESVCSEFIADSAKIQSLIEQIIADKKIKDDIDIKQVMHHYKHNLKMNALHIGFLPRQHVEEFELYWSVIQNSVLKPYDYELLSKLNVNRESKASNVMTDAIPNSLKI